MELLHKTIEVQISSSEGTLEALLNLPDPEPRDPPGAAVICHSHPLYGGSMHSKVVFAASHAFLGLGIPSLRFNFRGVGKSSGKYDNGEGEQEDVRASVDFLAEKYREKILIAGHSFGALIGMKAGCNDPRVKLLIGIGTPAGFSDPSFLISCPKPKLLIHGTQDRLIPIEKIEDLFLKLSEPKKLIRIEDSDHFFTGKLEELEEAIQSLAKEYLPTKN